VPENGITNHWTNSVSSLPPVVAIVIVEVPSVLVMPAVASIIPVSVTIAVAISEMTSPVVAVMIVVLREGKSAEDQGQAQKQY
jgi:hypothetical protein